jgi:hypothetical protein
MTGLQGPDDDICLRLTGTAMDDIVATRLITTQYCMYRSCSWCIAQHEPGVEPDSVEILVSPPQGWLLTTRATRRRLYIASRKNGRRDPSVSNTSTPQSAVTSNLIRACSPFATEQVCWIRYPKLCPIVSGILQLGSPMHRHSSNRRHGESNATAISDGGRLQPAFHAASDKQE